MKLSVFFNALSGDRPCSEYSKLSTFFSGFFSTNLKFPQSNEYESFFFFKQKTAYEMEESDWSSDVCSSDLVVGDELECLLQRHHAGGNEPDEIGRASCRERVFSSV